MPNQSPAVVQGNACLRTFGEIGRPQVPRLKDFRFMIGRNPILGPGGVDSYLMNEMKALVVDDDSLIRRNVADVLRNEGWEVYEADSAEQAIEMLHRELWPLVFCDVRLSKNNGDEGYAVLRSFTVKQPEARIGLMTGHGSAVVA